ncbi:MAG: hypothetical protein JW955_15975 [Sedimentisphaerales bacterium]|nr:hypothetical protein [Sedimentisphaerales bacterium]
MPRNISSANTYTDKLIKLIPAEWVSAYIAIKGILDSAQDVTHAMYWATFLILLVGLPFYLRRVLDIKAKKQIAVTTVSFIVWVFSLGGEHVGAIEWYAPYQGSILLILWTLAVPIFVGKHSSPSGTKPSTVA